MLSVLDLTCSFNDQLVLRGVDLDVHEGEIFCLLGPSGCGKTTLLRIIAGLEEATGGSVLLNDDSIIDIPVHKRGFGLMFQDFALFPHLTVAKNIIFGLKMLGGNSHSQHKRLAEVLELVGLEGFESRDVSQLSGGEKQRVALARSLAPNPRLLMLDEPLGSLDANLKARLVVELREIIKQVGLTAIYVTHDHQEAFAIADRIAIMNDGQIRQIGTPEDIYLHPKSVFSAQFLGLNNIVEVIKYEDKIAYTSIGEFLIESEPKALLIHPDSLQLASDGQLQGRVIERVFQGGVYRIRVELTETIVFRLNVHSNNGKLPQIGENVTISFADDAIITLM